MRPYLGEAAFGGYFKFAFVRNPFDRFVSLLRLHAAPRRRLPAAARDVMRHFLFEQPPERHILFQPQASLLVGEDGGPC